MDTENLTDAHRELVHAAMEVVDDFERYGPVLQQDDNLEYGPDSAIGRLQKALQD